MATQKKKEYSRRYIELSSSYRDRRNWPCPAEFTVPITCTDTTSDPLIPADKILKAYPVDAWYQVPYAAPKWVPNAFPRNINGVYYSSLWPLAPNLNNSAINQGQITAMHFSGGTRAAPLLNSVVVQQPNIWKGGDTSNIHLNPYYTPITNYFAGALLLRFKIDPSSELNDPNPISPIPLCAQPYTFCGYVESAIINSFNADTGEIQLDNELSEDFNPFNDFYLIDFNTDPFNSWAGIINGGPRIFIPNGPDRANAYAGFYVENYTVTENTSSGRINLVKISSYDSTRRIAYLDKPLRLLERPSIVSSPFPQSVFGSNTFTVRADTPSDARSFVRLGVANNSIANIQMKEFGHSFKIGETIASKDGASFFNDYYSSPALAPNAPYPVPDYLLSGPGTAFRGSVESVNVEGGILEISIEQQGQGFVLGNYYLESTNVNIFRGRSAVLYIPQTYQSIEIYRRDVSEGEGRYQVGDFFFLPSIGQFLNDGFLDKDPYTSSPPIPLYSFTYAGNVNAPVMAFDRLLIRKGEYPPRILDCAPDDPMDFPNTGVSQIVKVGYKDTTFNEMWNINPPIGVPDQNCLAPITVVFLNKEYILQQAGRTEWVENGSIPNASAFIPATLPILNQTGFLQYQHFEILSYSRNNAFPLNYTGSTVSQNQMVCYELELVSITLPNLPLENNFGGKVAFYPYFYVQFGNVTSPCGSFPGPLYSNNPNSISATFRLNVDDTNTPEISKFIKLDGDGTVQTIKFRPNDNLHFKVTVFNGDLFQVIIPDHPPPLPPDFFVQINALFEIKRLT